jgi:methionyl-tRNA formyltransferase
VRIIFAGTPEFAADHLSALIESECDVVAVYTQPDRPAGRGNKLKASEVKQLAQQHNLPVYQPESLKTEYAQQELADIECDLMVVVAYGLILPKAVLDTPKLGCINVHGSILPKWRGAAPIQRALWAGDKQTGVTIMQMDEGLDTGDILSIETLPIEANDTSASLYQKLAELGPRALVKSIENFVSLKPIQQDNEQATYAAKLSKQEAYLDWTMPSEQLERNIRAFNPWPVAWFSRNEKPIKVWQATIEKLDDSEQLLSKPGQVLSFDKNGLRIATEAGVLNIQELQLSGKKPQAVSQIVNGQPQLFNVGEILQ